jgi:hypothetical protein
MGRTLLMPLEELRVNERRSAAAKRLGWNIGHDRRSWRSEAEAEADSATDNDKHHQLTITMKYDLIPHNNALRSRALKTTSKLWHHLVGGA